MWLIVSWSVSGHSIIYAPFTTFQSKTISEFVQKSIFYPKLNVVVYTNTFVLFPKNKTKQSKPTDCSFHRLSPHWTSFYFIMFLISLMTVIVDFMSSITK